MKTPPAKKARSGTSKGGSSSRSSSGASGSSSGAYGGGSAKKRERGGQTGATRGPYRRRPPLTIDLSGGFVDLTQADLKNVSAGEIAWLPTSYSLYILTNYTYSWYCYCYCYRFDQS